jgi:cytochrome c oxidase accessory protein FixG
MMSEVKDKNTNTKPGEPDNSFRDHIATVNSQGKRNWIYPWKPSGKLYNARKILSYFYLVIFFALPFIKLNGHPVFLLNIIERKFIIFGAIFWPHDFFIFGIAMLALILFIVVFTVAFGRLFCGWACPQTIFLELVFRRIEYLIEGNATHQKALNKQPWNSEKILKKGSKILIFFTISFLISNTFLAYIIGVDELSRIITEPIGLHIKGFISILVFTGIFFAVFAWFREQACLIVCPYGRLQGVLLDKNSVVVAYDYVRGEPRGKFKKNETREKGDCIDCALCVKVCPTGIDIRHGTQLECVNCTACIDVCNDMMRSVNLPEGLIRYASENGIAEKKPLRFTKRMFAYSAVLFLLSGFLVYLISSRNIIEATVLRTPGQLFQEQPDNQISNLYNFKIINKSFEDIPVEIRLENSNGEIKMIGNDHTVKKESKFETSFFIILPSGSVKKRKTELELGIYSNGKKLETIRTTFLGPVTNK